MSLAKLDKHKKVARTATRLAESAASSSGRARISGIGELRVIVSHRDGFWFARGLEIDYAAQGSTLAEVKRNFERGLIETAALHLKTFGSLENLLRPSPPAAWRKFHQSAESFRDKHISLRKLPPSARKVIRFESLKFFMCEHEAAVA